MTTPIDPRRPAAFDEGTIRRFLSYIVDPAVGATEFRILGAQYQTADIITRNEKYSSTLSAWYDNANAIVNDARKLRHVSAYICLNPTISDLIGRAHNKLQRVRHATTDDDIVCLRWFYIDVDPVRPADISATHEELSAAVAKRDEILRDFPEIRRASLTGRSGNGAYIMARLPDYPNDLEHRSLVAAALDAIIARYSDARVKIDVKTKNPSRVGCVPGTLKCKGSHIPARPWKMATLDGEPEPGDDGRPPTLDLRAWLDRNPAPVAQPAGRPVQRERAGGWNDGRSSFDEHSQRLRRAAAYVATLPPGISGQNGHDATFHAACALVKGFDLSVSDASSIMAEFNTRCSPPWAAHEIDHKLAQADKIPDDRPRGYLHDARRDGWDDDAGGPRTPYSGPGADFVIAQVAEAVGGVAGGQGSPAVAREGAVPAPASVPAVIPEPPFDAPPAQPVPSTHSVPVTIGLPVPTMAVEPIRYRAKQFHGGMPEAVYRDAPFLLDLAKLERADPAEAAAIKSEIARIPGFKQMAFREAMTVPRRQAAKSPGNPAGAGNPGDGEGDESYSLSDMGNAQRFLAIHGHEARWCKAYGDWMVYDGVRWKQDDGMQADLWAQEIPGVIGASIRPDMDEDAVKSLCDWKLRSESKLSLANLLVVARASVPVVPEQFDQNPWVLNTQNGTIDLKTGEFREHRPEDLLTKVAPVTYDPQATCPRWERFVSDIMKGDPGLISYIKRIFGYAMTGVTKDHAFFVCYGGGGNGKALATYTPIATPGGWTTMGDLRVGDTVFDDMGKPCRVTFATEVMHGHDCYEVEFKDGSKIVADADHLWEVDSVFPGSARATMGKREVSCKTTAEIADSIYCGLRYATPGHPRDNLSYRHRIKLAGPIETPEADLPIDAFTLGAWLGDGHSKRAMITCHDSDRQTLDEIASCGVGVHARSRKGAVGHYELGDAIRYGRGDTKSLSAKLRILGVRDNKHIPMIYLRASIAQRFALMQGLMDTDGTISKAGQCEFAVVNRRLAHDFHELACSLGFKPTMRITPAKIGDKYHGNNFRIQFWAYSDTPVFRLKRKLARQKVRPVAPTQGSFRQIIGAKLVESVPVRCIQVDSPSHLYLAGKTMIPTHNTTLFNGIAHILGDYAIDLDPDVILAQSNAQHPTGLTDFEGRRLVVSEETDDKRGLAEALVKRLSGGDKIRARKMRGDFYTFKPTHHLFLATNHKPNIRNNDYGLWRRLKLIPFDVTFGDPDGKKTDKEIRKPDRDLMDKLIAESSGILNWMLAGCREWQEIGLAEPQAILDATQEYRTEMDELGWFLDERVDDVRDDPTARVVFRVLYAEYKAWADENNLKHPLGTRKFGAQLNDRGYVTKKMGGETYKRGLRLKINGRSMDRGPADEREDDRPAVAGAIHVGKGAAHGGAAHGGTGGREPGDDGDWMTAP